MASKNIKILKNILDKLETTKDEIIELQINLSYNDLESYELIVETLESVFTSDLYNATNKVNGLIEDLK